MKTVSLKVSTLVTMIGLSGSFCSIATYFVTTQKYEQYSAAEYSPNVANNGPVTINYKNAAQTREWFKEYEANRPNITTHQYHKVMEGMTYQEVVSVLGIEGVEQGSGGSGKSYAWGKAPFYYLHINFGADGKLQWKANSGLF